MITLLKQYIGYFSVSNRRRKPYIGYCGNQRLDIGLSCRRYGNVAFHHVLSVCQSEHNVCSDLTGIACSTSDELPVKSEQTLCSDLQTDKIW